MMRLHATNGTLQETKAESLMNGMVHPLVQLASTLRCFAAMLQQKHLAFRYRFGDGSTAVNGR